jgi:succinate-semialdehyde dehydrogenase/glutarate-semialdehyde dehydrogenase
MKINISDKDLYKIGAFIDGNWVDSDDRSTYSVNNPATGEIIADVAIVASRRRLAQLKRQNLLDLAGINYP